MPPPNEAHLSKAHTRAATLSKTWTEEAQSHPSSAETPHLSSALGTFSDGIPSEIAEQEGASGAAGSLFQHLMR